MVTLVNLRAYWRFVVVLRQFSPLIVAYWRDRRRYFLFGGSREVDAETQRERAAVLLDILLTLGPTFIKLGQILSTRPDILPPAYIEVLEGLQDDVPPAPWEESRVVLEDEFGPVDETFDDFDRDPISGASLGQVYTATYEGDEVAVKVRRPGIESLVEADLRTIRWSIPLVKRFTGAGRSFSLENLADEFAKTIREEMDYARERTMLEEIRGNFADNDRIRIPETYESVSGPRVLTMEYVPGTKISDIDALDEAGHDRTAIAEILQEVYLQMIIDDGVFHADPHPGNLAVADDGSVIFYDFGMAGRVDPFVQEKIVEFYVAVARQDIDAILDTLISMGTLSPEADREVMGNVMELAIADVRGEDVEQYQVNQIIEQVESSIYEFPLRLPPNLALVLRVATVVEGVCVTLDPEFDFISTATDYLREEGYYEQTARDLAEDAGRQVQQTTEALFTVPPKADEFLDRANRDDLTVNVVLEDDTKVLEKLAMRIAYSVLLAVGVLSATILYSFANNWRLALVVLALASPLAIALYRSFRKKRGLRTTPQFTRQGMKQRRDD
ncbi:AarF/ABC1/UbiB kinase family protein [Halorubrum ezzemoulense]|uniref:AarF/ABC1/UbiB kinase family protein n=1 Tax=Halorubrum ezzemoulense TaxID=337243 RepID=A0A256JZL1_HALEZ|nr:MULTISPECIES: AarF/ABC1/UbiB kinase family protein [Halorubrum]MDB2240085.1 AarF/ABC1/UbiB kinase family protein [Halorubrum ezzemoulense]MDB2243981.1 AarF/ABC1/UbiB kinase family protein [Halorubrum ezzemoulense]MDB2252047.1 AarF/ABC1/UbiB kinase family protein [Halorubrum ezzemoulense]MDB2260427.1 AarF/ABC1/UbiB kinase family protein [Halorubrum ezzemoulense]MDB2263828.1 AarF/ABC1/UbiB kinase family protein [Halorubrum ezzemoulense]